MSRLKPVAYNKQPAQSAWSSVAGSAKSNPPRNNSTTFNRNQSKWGLRTNHCHTQDESSSSNSSSSSSSCSVSSTSTGVHTKKGPRRSTYTLTTGGSRANVTKSAKSQPEPASYNQRTNAPKLSQRTNMLYPGNRKSTSSQNSRPKPRNNSKPNVNKITMNTKTNENLSPVLQPQRLGNANCFTGQHLVHTQHQKELNQRLNQQQKIIRHLKPPVAPKLAYQKRSHTAGPLAQQRPWRFRSGRPVANYSDDDSVDSTDSD